jgi:hypothetical protein
MLKLHKQLPKAKTSHEQESLKRKRGDGHVDRTASARVVGLTKEGV